MAHWIFKVSNQELYPDEPGQTYVYDNTHSVQVTANDSFVYLDKRGGVYAFTGHGVISSVVSKAPSMSQLRHHRVKRIYTAKVRDFVQYSRALDIRPASLDGRANRSALGITDVNKMGWSASIARLHPKMFERIVELAYQQHIIPLEPPGPSDYEVPDAWSLVKTRHSLERFKEAVLRRQRYTCAICGTAIREVLDVAHISTYSTDTKNRANPANGIGLCAYCHRAFDTGVFLISGNGVVLLAEHVEPDPVAEAHLSNLSSEARLQLLAGIDEELLHKRIFHGQPS